MQGVKDASGLYEVERRASYAARPGFRIVELQISPAQKVPRHYHNNVHDTFMWWRDRSESFCKTPKKRWN
jgi:hypothetical protein